VSWSFTDVRILLAGMSNMLSDIVTAVIAELPDSVVAGHAGEHDDLLSEIRLTNADVVMLQVARPGDAESFTPLLRGFPALRVVAMTTDGSSGYLYELRPTVTYLAELSAASLRMALRGDHGLAVN
jgi:DNA-binding NarL/FixJ family response regulator